MSKMGSKSGKGKLDWRRLTWQGSTCRSLVYLQKMERNVFLLLVLSYTYAIDHRWVHGRERTGLNYSKTFPEMFIFEHSH